MRKSIHQKLSKPERDRLLRIAKTSPVKIPRNASIKQINKASGYQQVTYHWQINGWQYTARWHSQLPTAKLVTKPSWRIDRIKRGQGFGASAHHRVVQSWSNRTGWIANNKLRQSAWRVNHQRGHRYDVDLIKDTHFESNNG